MNLLRRLFLYLAAGLVGLTAFSFAVNAQEWQTRHAMSPAQFQTVFDDLYKKGFRLKCLSGYVSGGAELYAALWLKEPGPAWQARSNMAEADFQKTFNDFSKQGLRLTWVSAHEANGVVHYEGIWEQKGGPAWEAKANLTAAEYQQAFDARTKQGYRPLHVWGYTSGGTPRFAVIFEQSSGPAWVARHDLNSAQYQQAFNDFAKQGYRLKVVSGYNVGGADKYAALWEKANGPFWSARNGIPDWEYQNVFDNFYYQGYRPLFVSAFTSATSGKLNVTCDNANFSGADLQFISSQMNAYMSANGVPAVGLAIT